MADRSTTTVENDIAAAVDSLVGNIEKLINAVHPKSLAAQTIGDAKQFAMTEARNAKQSFVYDTGEPRYDRIGMIVAAVGGALAFLLVIRSLVKR